MGNFIKGGILHTLKFHLHILSCHFWLNLWAKWCIYALVNYPSMIQIMARRLFGAKPLSELMRNIVYLTLRNKQQWNSNRNSNIFIQENAFESVVCEMAAILSRPQCVNHITATFFMSHWIRSSPLLQLPPSYDEVTSPLTSTVPGTTDYSNVQTVNVSVIWPDLHITRFLQILECTL